MRLKYERTSYGPIQPMININDNEIETALPSPKKILEHLPLSQDVHELVTKTRKAIQAIMDRKDPRILLVMGPCSIHHHESALEYAYRLFELMEEVQDVILPIMRAYVEKPRTVLGWKGYLNDPYLDGSYNVAAGLSLSRQLLLDINEIGVPVATEFLDPSTPDYIGDLVSWGTIGARTVASPIHREMASIVNMPMGLKNSLDGNCDTAIAALIASRTPQQFRRFNAHGQLSLVRSSGNAYSSLVLRGGKEESNFQEDKIANITKNLKDLNLPSKVVVDCSHGNCRGNYLDQERVFHQIISQIEEGNQDIMGLMLESHILPGTQPYIADPTILRSDVSITDPCLDWESSKKLALEAAARLRLLRN